MSTSVGVSRFGLLVPVLIGTFLGIVVVVRFELVYTLRIHFKSY